MNPISFVETLKSSELKPYSRLRYEFLRYYIDDKIHSTGNETHIFRSAFLTTPNISRIRGTGCIKKLIPYRYGIHQVRPLVSLLGSKVVSLIKKMNKRIHLEL